MAKERIQRRLAAILAADIVGYSRLMEEDESVTLAALKDRRATVIDPLIAAHHGRIVKLMGDGTLAEFASVLDAVQCAIAVQRGMSDRNAAHSGDRKIELRIGINLGDVIPDGDDIYGEGVNVAARLEPMAEPGGICISGTVHDAIGRDLASGFEFIGEQAVKNLLKPVRAYRHMEGPGAVVELSGPPLATRRSTAPSLAVKPFENLSGDPEQEVFVYALSNGIMVALTRVPGLTLVHDESPFLAQSRQMSEQEIALRFGVQYLLKGDLRKLGDRVRVSVELMEVSTGRYLWAEKFDRNLSDYDDLFSLQDEITEQIVISLDVKLLGGEAVRMVRKVFTNPAALDSYFRGEYLMWNAKSNLELHNAQSLLEEAIRLEPTCSAGFAAAAIAYWVEGLSGQGEAVAQVMDRAERHAREAIRLGDVTGYPRLVLAQLHLSRREFEEASSEAELAVSARPSCPASYTLKASVLNYLGRSDEAIEHAEFALRLTPVHPPMYPAILASALYGSGRNAEAIAAARSAIEMDERNIDPYLVLAESSIALGRSEEARRAAGTVKKIQPEFTLAKFAESQPYEDQRQLNRLLEQLRQAGLE